MNESARLTQTPLHPLHLQANAKMVPFAGYDMPVSYPLGIIGEHLHTREKAGLFDVSHMGQIHVSGTDAAAWLESLIPVDIISLAADRQRYGLLLNHDGGVLDDLMVIRRSPDTFILVVNAACKTEDFQHLKENAADNLRLELDDGRSLLALQGPKSADVMKQLGHDLADMSFMAVREITLHGMPCLFSRSGYTGEDGFEISMHNEHATAIAELLLSNAEVAWVGLGARDSLRMEAGLPLYGHELTPDTTPIEAGLVWAISKARRTDGERAGGFPGADIVLPQIPKNVEMRLVGLQPEGKAPVREGAMLEDDHGNPVGTVTSGGFSPSTGRPICMGYVDIGHSSEQSGLHAVVRNRRLPVGVTRLPFVERHYYRKP